MLATFDVLFPMQELTNDVERIEGDWIKKVTYDLADMMEENFNEAVGTSRNRNIYGKRRSAPGEIPVRETGRLAESVDALMIDRTHGIVEVTAPYAAELEYDRDRFFINPAIRDLFDLYDNQNIFD